MKTGLVALLVAVAGCLPVPSSPDAGRPCAQGTFETSDGGCAAWRTCAPGEFVRAEGTPLFDRRCSSCAPGTYSDVPNAPACAAWRTCPVGAQPSEGTATTNRLCTPCESGTWSAGPGLPCLPWSDCAPGMFLVGQGSVASDRVCAPCAAGTFSTRNAAACTAFSDCMPGTLVASEGTATTDRSCLPCAAGTFSDRLNATTCAAWPTCTVGQFVQREGSASAPRECAPCPAGSTTTTPNAPSCLPGVSLGGQVRGLTGSGLVLSDGRGGTLAISGDGPFLFSTPVPLAAPWTVTVQTQPTNQSPCTVRRGSGTAQANVSSVMVDCGLTFRVVTVTPSSVGTVGLPGARAVLVGPSRTVQATADDDGYFSAAFPPTQRPFSLTVAAAGHEALTVLRLDQDVPTTLYVGPMSYSVATAPLTGAITGKAASLNRVSVDVYDGTTVQTTAASYTSAFQLGASSAPVQVVAIEVENDEAINWVASPVLARSAAGHTVDVAFPSPRAALVETSLTVAPAPSGVFSSLAGATYFGTLAFFPGDTSSALTTGWFTYVVSGWLRRPVGLTMVGRGVTGPLAPNRVVLAVDRAPYALRLWVRDPLTQPTHTLTAPVVTSLTSSGSSLRSVQAEGAGASFDTLALQVTGSSGSGLSKTAWRIYTAPGTSQAIQGLPLLPVGVTLADLGLGSTARVTPMLIRFADRASRPWMIPAGNDTFPLYELTASGASRVVSVP